MQICMHDDVLFLISTLTWNQESKMIISFQLLQTHSLNQHV